MPETRGPDAWLVEANKGWQERSRAALDRAHVAEMRVIHAEGDAARARSSARSSRNTAVVAWAWMLSFSAEWYWHCPRWTPLPVMFVAATVNAAVDWRQAKRRRKQVAAKREAERRELIAEMRRD